MADKIDRKPIQSATGEMYIPMLMKDLGDGTYAPEVHVNNPSTGGTPTDVSALATKAIQTDGTQKTQVTNFPATQNVSITSPNPLPVSVVSTETRDFIYQQTIIGNSFAWSSGVIGGLAVASNLRVLLSNTTTSKSVYIYSFVIDNGSGNGIFPTILVNPTGNLPTTPRSTGTNLNMASTNTVGVTMYADATTLLATGMTGGVTVPAPYCPGNSRTQFFDDEQVFILTPGGKVGVSIPIGIGTSTNYQVVVYGIVY